MVTHTIPPPVPPGRYVPGRFRSKGPKGLPRAPRGSSASGHGRLLRHPPYCILHSISARLSQSVAMPFAACCTLRRRTAVRSMPPDHFPEATKACWDLEGIYCTSRNIPGVRFAGLIHPGLIGTERAPARPYIG